VYFCKGSDLWPSERESNGKVRLEIQMVLEGANGEIYPAENPSVAEEQKGITPVEREALELSMKSHRRAIDLLAQH